MKKIRAVVGATLLILSVVGAACARQEDNSSASTTTPQTLTPTADTQAAAPLTSTATPDQLTSESTAVPAESAPESTAVPAESAPESTAVPTESVSESTGVPAESVSESTGVPAESVFEVERLEFSSCGRAYQCATLEVPVNHDDPEAGTLTLELGMLPAADPEKRIGALLVNPGGPGGGMDGFLDNGAGLLPDLLDRFDVVGWNPRGVMGRGPNDCRDEANRLMLLDPVPDTADEQIALDEAARQVAEVCQAELGRYIGTEATVDDMDLIRQALGEQYISYFGFSYGSLLGQLYADRYGDHARAVVIDGVVDPSLDLEQASVGQIEGFARVIEDLFDNCQTDWRCHLSDDPRADYEELLARVETDPLLDSSGNVLVGPAEALLAIVISAYSPGFWPLFYDALDQALGGDGQLLHDLGISYLLSADMGSFISINCTDTGRISEADLDRLIERMGEAAGHFGRSSATSAFPCVYWADTEPFPVEPIRAPDASAVLVIGNRGDNATPYEWSVSVAETLETGVLLTYNGEGHTSYRRHYCVDQVVHDYLIDLSLPPDDIECG